MFFLSCGTWQAKSCKQAVRAGLQKQKIKKNNIIIFHVQDNFQCYTESGPGLIIGINKNTD